jgi:hypothetical protein
MRLANRRTRRGFMHELEAQVRKLASPISEGFLNSREAQDRLYEVALHRGIVRRFGHDAVESALRPLADAFFSTALGETADETKAGAAA